MNKKNKNERSELTRMDSFYLSFDSLFSELLGGLDAVSYLSGEADESDIRSFDFDLGLADGEDEIGGLSFNAQGERFVVSNFVFQEDDGVVISNGGLVE